MDRGGGASEGAVGMQAPLRTTASHDPGAHVASDGPGTSTAILPAGAAAAEIAAQGPGVHFQIRMNSSSRLPSSPRPGVVVSGAVDQPQQMHRSVPASAFVRTAGVGDQAEHEHEHEDDDLNALQATTREADVNGAAALSDFAPGRPLPPSSLRRTRSVEDEVGSGRSKRVRGSRGS